MKNKRLDIRLSENELRLIRMCANYYHMNVTNFIRSLLIPCCYKIESKMLNLDTDSKKGKQ